MRRSYFHRAYEAAEDTGAADAIEPDETLDDEAEVEAPAPETYTRDQLAELLGPRFERFAAHEGEEAFRQFGSAYENATGLIRQGAHLSPQDQAIYESIGLDPNEVQLPEPEVDQGPAIWNAPWETPSDFDRIQQLAQSEHFEHRKMAADAVQSDQTAPEDVKRAFWDNAYGAGNYDALVYNQRALQAEMDRREREMEERVMQRVAPALQATTDAYVGSMIAQASATIPGFEENRNAINALMTGRRQKFGEPYEQMFERKDAEGRQWQLEEMRELNLIAAANAAPQREAANQAAAEQTDAAKLRARTETSRTSGAPETDVDETVRNRREAMRRVGARIT